MLQLRLNPCPGYEVTTPYGVPGEWAAGFHTGDDYSTHGRIGIPIISTWPGWVFAVGTPWGPDYGLQVIVSGPLGKIRMGYCHLSSAALKPGEWVSRGRVLGHSGNSGRSTGPHLHYEERRSPFGYGDVRRPRRNNKGNHA